MRDTPLCLYPFYHQLVRPDGTGMPCCSYSEEKKHLSNIHHSEFFHSKWMDDLRAAMWEDTVPDGCKSCIAGEEAGGFSNRGYSIYRANQMGFDYTQGHKLLGQELNISNLCNLRCRMCDSNRSSKWIAEDLLYETDVTSTHFRTTAKLQKSGWSLSSEEAKTIKFLTFLGGEPMLHQSQIIDSLKEVKKHNRLHDISVNINSNMVTSVDDQLVELLIDCKLVNFNASIDAYGLLNDYIRSDSVWDNLLENMLKLDSLAGQHGNVRWQTINTVTVINCNKMNELYEWLDNTFKHAGQPSPAILAVEPWYLAVNNLPQDVKDNVLQKLIETKEQSIVKFRQHTKNPNKKYWGQHYDALCNYVSGDPAHMPVVDDWREDFWKFTNFLDQSRGTKFSDVNPEMAEWLKI